MEKESKLERLKRQLKIEKKKEREKRKKEKEKYLISLGKIIDKTIKNELDLVKFENYINQYANAIKGLKKE